MDFYAVLDQVLALLRQRGRVSYRALQRQFDLDAPALADLKDALLFAELVSSMRRGAALSGRERPPPRHSTRASRQRPSANSIPCSWR